VPAFCQICHSPFGPDFGQFAPGVLGSSQLSLRTISRRGCWHGRRGISPNYDDTYHPRRGGSPSEEPGTLRFATRVCWTSTKRVSCRTEIVASPRRIRKAHRAPSTRGAFPCATPFPFFSQFGYCGRGPPRRSGRPLIPAVARRIT